ncbi:MAG: M28 family peptidase, partial [Thermoplasmatales archaeon]
MKKKHAISITIIMLLLLALIPSNSCAIPRGNPMRADYDDSFTYGIVDDNQDPDVPSGDPPYLPFPGEIIENPPMFQNFHIPKRQPHHHEFSVKSQNDLIVDILLQLNESLYLGYLEDIVSFGPRRTGTPSCQQAGEYIYTQFKAMGLEAQYHNWTYGGYSSSNIEGTLVGENETSDEIYIICAHYDTVSGSPGADDDGSGTAAVLVAADIFSKYAVNHTVRFVAFSGEEQGLLGSYEYAREASQNGDNIIGVLNGDMIGFAISTYDGNNIKIYENTESHWLTLFTEEISELYDEYIELNIIPSGSSGGSDHYSFWQWGYDSIFYHEYNFNDYYHSSQDTIENMNITYTTKSSRLMIGTLAALAQAVVPSEPPHPPSITGPKTGIEEEEYEFTFVTTDPEGDDVYYYVEWGDDTHSEWFGPYNSGEEATATHTWTLEGDYEIRAKAKDIYDVE